MKHAETVTFGGSALNRVDHIRRDQASIDRAFEDPGATAIAFWRGKPLVLLPDLDGLCRLPVDHPLFADAQGAPILLGCEESGSAVFAYDLSAWMPEDLEAASIGAFVDMTEQVHPAAPDQTGFAELRRIMVRLSPRDAELAATAKALFGWHDSHRFCARCGQESRMANAGWQRSCPGCGGQHFPRTDPVVIMLITHGHRTLLGRSHGWPEGMYSCLAGFIEPGETVEAAVRREVLEEAGVKVGPVRYLSSQPWAFPSSLMLGCHGEALSDEIRIDPEEIDDAIWVSKSELMAAFCGQNDRILPARKGAIAHFLLQNWLADILE